MAHIDVRGATISEGTLQPQHLIRAFGPVLEDLQPGAVTDIRADLAESGIREGSDEFEAYFLDALFDALDEHAPDGYSFGSLEGDGACFGFWHVCEDGGDDSYDDEACL